MKCTPENITSLPPNHVFVFGSNLAGRHGKGAALIANLRFGAVYYNGVGRQGQSYAIPTKDHDLKTLPLDIIRKYVDTFLFYAVNRLNETFVVTPIGCGLAGYKPADIAPMFLLAPSNMVLPASFQTIIAQL